MHELGLAKDVLQKILDCADELGFSKIRSADVGIGETLISHKEEFHELFNQISKGTPADGVSLKVTIIPLTASCNECGNEFKAKEMKVGCPKCQSNDLKIVAGKEILIKELK
jgi:hydrogenase nickel incorporation protein HypA/HybF